MFLKPEAMTLEQKLGMVICARRFLPEDVTFIKEMVRKHALGSIQIPPNEPELAREILSLAEYPILVAGDSESGFPVSRLPKVPPISLAACEKKEYYEAFAKGNVRDAQAAGFNCTWGPVIDVLDGDRPCAVNRCYSDDPMRVAEVAEVIAQVYKDNHFLSCGKHFPGVTQGLPFDTHMTEGICDCTKEELLQFALVPYQHLLKKDLLPSAMVAHTVYRNIDPDYPASLSKKVLDIIREMGFDGVMFTDSFAMMGILQKYGEEKIYGMAIHAGNDIILPNYRTAVKDVYEMLLQNYKDGVFSEERLNEAVRRVLKAQAFVGTKPEHPTSFTPQDEELLRSVAKDCITAVTDAGIGAALDGSDRDKLFIVTQSTRTVDASGAEISFGRWYDENRVAAKIRKEFPNAGLVFLPEFSQANDHQNVLLEATRYREVIYITFCNTEAYLGTDCLTRRTEAVLNALIHSGKVEAVVHFGNPYALKNLLPVKRKIFGYQIQQSQEYAIDVLKGTLKAKGKLPYNIGS